MIDRDGFGHSQEVVGSASGHVGLAAAGGGVKLKAEEEAEGGSVSDGAPGGIVIVVVVIATRLYLQRVFQSVV